MNPVLNDILPPLEGLKKNLEGMQVARINGRVEQVVGLVIESTGPSASVGEACWITPADGKGEAVLAEVVGFRQHRVLLMPLGEMRGLGPGSEVVPTGQAFRIPVGDCLLGRVIDAMGKPMDGKGSLGPEPASYPIHREPPSPMDRRRITRPMPTGVRALDALLTLGEGQRLGIFSGSGVGKSTLLGMIARNTEADVNVIALVGERGREVKDFLERDLGEEGLKRSVVVVATSDQPSLIRIQAALVATAVAEYFRDQGKRVMLMMDSVTRFAMAQREIGLSAGEPPASKGYTPTVFAELPRLLERAGPGVEGPGAGGANGKAGTITGLFTVLVEGDDHNEPVSDAVRGILDGHIVLERAIAERGRFPAINILKSVSRAMPACNTQEEQKLVLRARAPLTIYEDMAELIRLGAYKPGTNPEVDNAMRLYPALEAFLAQSKTERALLSDGYDALSAILDGAEGSMR